MKAAYVGAVSRILAQVLAVLLTVGLSLYIVNRSMQPSGPPQAPVENPRARRCGDRSNISSRFSDEGLSSYPINVEVNNGAVILTGQVPSETVKKKVEEVTRKKRCQKR